MKKIELVSGDFEIVYDAHDNGIIKEAVLKCVMCGEPAFFIAKETKEPLCVKCFKNNAEARSKK